MLYPIRESSGTTGALRTLLVALATLVPAPACGPDTPLPVGPRVRLPAGPLATVVGASVTVLPTLGGNTTLAFDINEAGQVVGWSRLRGDTVTRAFLWTPGQGIRDLGTLGGRRSSAFGINDAGQVVGSSTTADEVHHAFLWTPGQGMQDLGTLDGRLSSEAFGINNAGQVVGSSYNTVSASGHAFLWTPGHGMQNLGSLGGVYSEARAVNTSVQVVGSSTTAGGAFRAFLWTPGQGMKDLGTVGDFTTAASINDAGQVVGGGYTRDHAFLWTAADGMRDLGTLGGVYSSANGINEAGQVVGSSYTAESEGHAFLWTASGGMEDLYSLTGMTSASAINNRGQVAGGNRVATLSFYTPNRAPVASPGGPYTGAKRKPLAFDGSRSADPDGDALTYAWDYGDGSPPGSGATPVHEYNAWGTYTVTLTVQDTAGMSDARTTTVTITPPGHLKQRP